TPVSSLGGGATSCAPADADAADGSSTVTRVASHTPLSSLGLERTRTRAPCEIPLGRTVGPSKTNSWYRLSSVLITIVCRPTESTVPTTGPGCSACSDWLDDSAAGGIAACPLDGVDVCAAPLLGKVTAKSEHINTTRIGCMSILGTTAIESCSPDSTNIMAWRRS